MGFRPEPRAARPLPHRGGPHPGRAVFFLALFSFAVVAACADILGINDRTLTSSGTGAAGSGGTGASGGAGGATGCETDADCTGSPFGARCDTAKGACVECLPGPEDTCAFGLYCDTSELCFIGCADDADCNQNGQDGPLKCDVATHQCVECGAGALCPPGSKCNQDTHVCVPGCDASSECPTTDWQCCTGQCRNVTKDVLNCGACDDPCEPSDSTTWLCLDGGCVFQSCVLGHADCDQNLAEKNGCEVNTQTDAANCGGCKMKCALDHAGAVCQGGECAIGSCNSPYQNCDGKADNGCETNLDTDAANCGDCGQSCDGAFTHGTPTCQGGGCVFGGCEAGYGDCNGSADDGCEVDVLTNVQHCGACGDACNLPHATPACMGGQCEVSACAAGWSDCDGDPANGCETNLNADPASCGTCGKSCDVFANATGICNGGQCELGACKAGFDDCDGTPANGCEASLSTTSNCGTCGTVCGTQGATMAACTAGKCQITCDATHGNCDGAPGNGCETSTSTNVAHCGMCNNACPANGGTPNCVNGMCGTSMCGTNLADCDGNGSCETSIDTPQNCGGCGNACSTNHTTQVACTGSPLACLLTCEDGWGDCNGDPADGCEQPLTTNQNCTACGTVCQADHANTSCSSGTCQIVSCQQGYANCNGNPADGCEAQLATDTANCGACNNPCTPMNANGQCTNGTCGIQSCNSGYLDCNNSANDGCEVDKTSDLLNCGACGATCSFNHASAQCVFPGMCQLGACDANYNNCDGMNANGCETNTQTSTQHCGACNSPCSSIHGAATCDQGTCDLACNSGWDDCNGLGSDGCETSLHTLMDCGACSVPCSLPHAGESCSTGVCQLGACDPGYSNCDQTPANGCECGPNLGCMVMMCQGAGGTGGAGGAGGSGGAGGMMVPVCPDGFCQFPEDCLSCPDDCGSCPTTSSGGGMMIPVCPDGFCQFPEDCMSCPSDCGLCPTTSSGMGGSVMVPVCPDGFCDFPEDCMTCPTDCGPCGTGGMGGGP